MTVRSASLQRPAQTYTGNAYVYILASRLNPELSKIGKGNPTARCESWNRSSVHGGPLHNALYVYAAFAFDSEEDALAFEGKAHDMYAAWNMNPNAVNGEQEFFAVIPAQSRATLDILHNMYVAQRAERAALRAEADAARAALEATEMMQEQRRRAALQELTIEYLRRRGDTEYLIERSIHFQVYDINYLRSKNKKDMPENEWYFVYFETVYENLVMCNFDVSRAKNNPLWFKHDAVLRATALQQA